MCFMHIFLFLLIPGSGWFDWCKPYLIFFNCFIRVTCPYWCLQTGTDQHFNMISPLCSFVMNLYSLKIMLGCLLDLCKAFAYDTVMGKISEAVSCVSHHDVAGL